MSFLRIPNIYNLPNSVLQQKVAEILALGLVFSFLLLQRFFSCWDVSGLGGRKSVLKTGNHVNPTAECVVFRQADTPSGGVGSLYLNLLQLLLVGGIHLLKSLLQLPVPLQQALAQLGGQLQVCVRDTQSSGFGCWVAKTIPLAHFSM